MFERVSVAEVFLWCIEEIFQKLSSSKKVIVGLTPPRTLSGTLLLSRSAYVNTSGQNTNDTPLRFTSRLRFTRQLKQMITTPNRPFAGVMNTSAIHLQLSLVFTCSNSLLWYWLRWIAHFWFMVQRLSCWKLGYHGKWASLYSRKKLCKTFWSCLSETVFFTLTLSLKFFIV